MKKVIAIILVVLMAVCFVGCGKQEENVISEDTRELFNLDLSKYIELGEYKEIPVDTSSKTFKGFYDDVIKNHIESNQITGKKTEGKVAEGDTANIDYVGKKDGVAFEGGTASGYDLTIGSNSFIDGFEDGLIGVEIGDTVDLDLTFPENYQSADLAGADVVFTVKVNYVKTDEGVEPKDYYADLGFKSLKDYEKEVKETAIKNYLLDAVKANSKVNKYPSTEKNKFYKSYKESAEAELKNQNATLEQYLTSNNITEKQFKEEAMKNQVEPMLDQFMLVYAIADKEGLVIDDKAINKQVDEMVKEQDNEEITADYIKEYYKSNYGSFYLEYMTVTENVVDLLYDNAVIK